VTNGRSKAPIAAIVLLVIVVSGLIGAGLAYGVIRLPLAVTPLSSWNPTVTCTPTLVKITDITVNTTGIASLSASPFAPADPNKRWLTPGSTPPGWMSPGPPCSQANANGIGSHPVFVEIDGVFHESTNYEDCASSYDSSNGGGLMPAGHWCDETGNILDPNYVANPSSTNCPTATSSSCFGKIHVEWDRDWSAANHIGPNVAFANNNTYSGYQYPNIIDVQGFVYWDFGQCSATSCTQQWHSFSGWELHPLTAWRPHQAPPPPPTITASFAFNPSPIAITNSPVTFSASMSGGTLPYKTIYGWGDGSPNTNASGTGGIATHTYTTPGTYTVVLFASDSSNPVLSATASAAVIIVSPTSALVATFTFNPSSPAVGTSISLLSTISGGVTPYSVSWNFGDGFTATGLTTMHAYATPGSYPVTLTVTDSANPPNSQSSTQNINVQGVPPPTLNAGFTYSPTIPVAAQPVTFTAIVSGGTAPYTYSWNFGDGAVTGDGGNNIGHTYVFAGHYNVTLRVVDSTSRTVTVMSVLTVQNPAGTGTGTAPNTLFLYIIIAAALGSGLGIGVFAVAGGKRKR